MLTDSEELWLERREFIHQCKGYYIWAGYWEEGVELEMMQEAAEFEARVAARLSQEAYECKYEVYAMQQALIYGQTVAWAYLKLIRLAVEEDGC